MSWKFLRKVLEEDNEFSRRFIEFEPGIGKVNWFTSSTGYDEIQQATAEYNLGWHVFGHEGSFYLCPDKLPVFKIRLGGEKGFKNLFKISSQYGEIYSNEKIQGIGTRLTKEIFESMPKFLKEGKEFILADEYLSQEERTIVHGVCVCDCDSDEGLHGQALSVWHDGVIYEMSVEEHMMPIIRLSPNTLVEMEDDEMDGSEPKKALKIRVASDAEVRRQTILDLVEASEELNSKIRKELSMMRI